MNVTDAAFVGLPKLMLRAGRGKVQPEEGSEEYPCEDCGEPTLFGLDAQEKMEEARNEGYTLHFFCGFCGVERMAKEMDQGTVTELRVTGDASAEAESLIDNPIKLIALSRLAKQKLLAELGDADA